MKRLTALLLAVGLAFAGSVSAQKVIKYAHFQPGTPDQPKQAAALAFKAYVEGASGGALQVQIYPASQLGDAATVLEGLQLGTIELGVVHDGPIAGFFKPVELFSMPYLFDNQKVAWNVFDGPFMDEFATAMKAQAHLVLLGVGDNGIRHFTNDVRPIVTPADMKGLKIRVQPSPIYQRLVESLGASPSAISWPELPAALQQGVVDGEENGVTNILAASLYQSQKYISLDAPRLQHPHVPDEREVLGRPHAGRTEDRADRRRHRRGHPPGHDDVPGHEREADPGGRRDAGHGADSGADRCLPTDRPARRRVLPASSGGRRLGRQALCRGR